KRVTVKNGLWKPYFVKAEIGDERAERRVADRYSHGQAEGEATVDEDLAELTRFCRFCIQVHRLRVMRQRADQKIVGLGDGAGNRMRYAVPHLPFVEIAPCHAGRSKPAVGSLPTLERFAPGKPRLQLGHADPLGSAR